MAKSTPTMVATFLRELREELGVRFAEPPWRQEDLAALLGVSEITISHWEQGVRVPKQRDLDHLERCRRLAELGVDPRTVRAEPVRDLTATKTTRSGRGYPAGRPRS